MRQYYPFFFFILFSFIGVNHSFAQCNRASDSLALIELYNTANGVNWDFQGASTTYFNNSQGYENVSNFGNRWDSLGFGLPINQWHGIVVNSDGCVSLLILKAVNIDTLPSLNLPNLKGLFVLNNDTMKGPIPDLSTLSLLRQIDFSNNYIISTCYENAPHVEFQLNDSIEIAQIQHIMLGK